MVNNIEVRGLDILTEIATESVLNRAIFAYQHILDKDVGPQSRRKEMKRFNRAFSALPLTIGNIHTLITESTHSILPEAAGVWFAEIMSFTSPDNSPEIGYAVFRYLENYQAKIGEVTLDFIPEEIALLGRGFIKAITEMSEAEASSAYLGWLCMLKYYALKDDWNPEKANKINQSRWEIDKELAGSGWPLSDKEELRAHLERRSDQWIKEKFR